MHLFFPFLKTKLCRFYVQIGPKTRLRAPKVRIPPIRMSTSETPTPDPIPMSREEFESFKKQMAEMANLMKKQCKPTQELRSNM